MTQDERRQAEADWLPHDGGPCPVDPNSRPFMRFRSGWDASESIRRDKKWRARWADWTACVAYLPQDDAR